MPKEFQWANPVRVVNHALTWLWVETPKGTGLATPCKNMGASVEAYYTSLPVGLTYDGKTYMKVGMSEFKMALYEPIG